MWKWTEAGCKSVLMALLCVSTSGPHAGPYRSGAGEDWTAYAGDSNEMSFSRLRQINASSVKRLGLSWFFDLPGEVSLESTPISVHGILYFTGSYATVYAVNGATGRLLWKHDPEVWKTNPGKLNFLIYPVNRGVAYANGRIFSASGDGRLFALDAGSGQVLWVVDTTDPKSLQTITGAPRTFNGRVIIGNGGADLGMRGYVTAYDEASGHQLWRFYTVPGSPDQNRGDVAMERAAETWKGEYWKTGTGGAVWDSITFDRELNRLYLGTANAGPHDPERRSPGGGDNLYTASIVAIDAETGKYIWHYQVNPRDSWDFDCTQRITLADLLIEGRQRKVLMQAPKNGFFYVLDRLTGKLISAQKIGKVTWADRIDIATGRPVEAANIRYETGELTLWPSSVGAHSWQAMSYSPRTGLVYIPYMQLGEHVRRGSPEADEIAMGGLSLNWVKGSDPQDGQGALLAWDPVRQSERWRIPLNTLWNGGTLVTAGNLTFQGTADGGFYAYDAVSGKKLWHLDVGRGISAAPMSFSVNSKQYVSILVGYGGSTGIVSNLMNVGWKYNAQPRVLLTFGLDGKAELPPAPAPDLHVNAVDDPSISVRAEDVTAGHKLFLRCASCHGLNLVSSGAPGPDLRESQLALNPERFWAIVHDGVLLSRGMPRFDTLTREQVMQLYAYIRAGAREAAQATSSNHAE
jgi:quinohemoprotein ethanol dehydrogenase